MGFYTDRVLPHLIRLTMRSRDFEPYRRRTLAEASGRVLEIGVGAGANLPIYGSRARELVGIDSSPQLAAMARRAAARAAIPATIIEASAERIPLDDASIESVVMTWTLCSISDPSRALGEIRRVLKPDGRLLFVEHGLAPDARVRKWQQRLTPVWKRFAGGCHLNRAMNVLIENAGFRIERLDTGYMHGLRPITFMYEGRATPT